MSLFSILMEQDASFRRSREGVQAVTNELRRNKL
jgi:hypothetical protein